MGYLIDFTGQFDLNRPLAPEHRSYLHVFSEVRHIRWDAELLEQAQRVLQLVHPEQSSQGK